MTQNETSSTQATQAYPQPPTSAQAPRRRRISPLAWVLGLSALLFVLFMMVTGAFFLRRGSSGGGRGGAMFAESAIGVVELKGVIMDSKKIVRQLERIEEEDSVKAVVLRIDSPGGAVAPSQEIYQAVRAFKKPLVASMATVAASGGFYVACGAKKVYANPGTLTGSIGVIMDFVNLEKLYEWARIKRYSLKTGKFKGTGAEYREMTPEERELLQTMLEDVLGQFKSAVMEGRKIPKDKLDAIADGRIFSGAQAKARGLVDELGTFQDAVNDAAQMAGLKGKPRLVYPEGSRRKWLEMLLDAGGGDDHEDSIALAPEPVAGAIQQIGRALMGGGAVHTQGATSLSPGLYWLWAGPGA